jgi:branched-chain amino acid aminotransferase
MEIRIDAEPPRGPVQLPEPLGFGRVFTPHMFTERWDAAFGWHDAAIGPRQPLVLDASAQVLHAGQAIFEGTKAYRRPDGRVQLFRPEANAARFNRSASRMGMPELPVERFVDAIEALVGVDAGWVPSAEGASLYVRPVMVATEPTFEVRAARSFLHYVILSPSGPYFSGGFQPVGVRVAEEHIRAAPRGTGEAKTPGNYAGSLAAIEAARAGGYQQVLWLDAVERRYVEEAGAMNVAFVVEGREIVTPALSGSILHGITRDSVLRLAPDLGLGVREERLDIDAVLADVKRARITEVFCMGTAAVIVPVNRIGYRGEDVAVSGAPDFPVAQRLYRALTGIQTGRAPDPYGWTRVVNTPQLAAG